MIEDLTKNILLTEEISSFSRIFCDNSININTFLSEASLSSSQLYEETVVTDISLSERNTKQFEKLLLPKLDSFQYIGSALCETSSDENEYSE